MSEELVTLGQRKRAIQRHLGTLILSAIIAAGAIGWGWRYFVHYEARLDAREAAAASREHDVSAQILENEKLRLALEQERTNLDALRSSLTEREARLLQREVELFAKETSVGRSAEERALRDEARQLMGQYMELMATPESHRDRCAEQVARKATRPLLSRIRSIGEQLRDGDDLVDFVESQSLGIWTSACDASKS